MNIQTDNLEKIVPPTLSSGQSNKNPIMDLLKLYRKRRSCAISAVDIYIHVYVKVFWMSCKLFPFTLKVWEHSNTVLEHCVCHQRFAPKLITSFKPYLDLTLFLRCFIQSCRALPSHFPVVGQMVSSAWFSINKWCTVFSYYHSCNRYKKIHLHPCCTEPRL